MILLWGAPTDGPLAAVRAALASLDAETFLLDPARARETAIVADRLRCGDDACDLAAISAVYLRNHSARLAAPGAAEDPALAAHADRLDAALAGFLEVTPARVVNPLAAMATNGSKPYQSALIAAHGFAVPDTLVTTDAALVRDFADRHGAVVYKSTSAVRSIVTRLQPADLARLDDVAWCPTQFQRRIPGRDYRVHVVGEAVFAAEIVSEADDYRYGEGRNADIHASRVPAPVADRCRALARALGLSVAGIDLRLTPAGEWYCFEANPSPAFTFYEAATGQAIAAAVAALLRG